MVRSFFVRMLPHATFGVKVVEEVPQVDPIHFQSGIKDPRAENRGTVFGFGIRFKHKIKHEGRKIAVLLRSGFKSQFAD